MFMVFLIGQSTVDTAVHTIADNRGSKWDKWRSL
jgi:hypothetical protein